MNNTHASLQQVGLLVAFLTALGTTACADDNPFGPADKLAPPENVAASQGSQDTVYWQDNVLEFTDDNGDSWRVERDQQQATEADLYKNGEYQGRLNLSYQGSEVTQITFTDPTSSHWAETDTTGAVLDTDEGIYSSG